MKNILTTLLLLAAWVTYAQTQVTEEANITTQNELYLDLDFAGEIVIKTWDQRKVKVDVTVSINGGEDNDIFELEKRIEEDRITFRLKTENWKKLENRANQRDCTWETDLHYTVYMPADMQLEAKTISGSYMLAPRTTPTRLKTISGDIDITVPAGVGLLFDAKTISGEIYTDLDVTYPNGTDGLRQVVGMDVRGQIGDGQRRMDLHTISGNVYLRDGQ
ncbi:DUF4097 family beta strand repeat-containing protein [Marinoscillum furvescens]|uniref:Adhesin domain-containing protein n=1 Tax=Marinoscillum furvescens DSM 4134 TaxID=1122208 RepID=A0A3D9KXV6_MARFU|nr:hypothetical protein [Marinoscillum furvescens]RED94081.1 hypothetical protein C7460_12222 [Marinoscillum furvescens DSM 4134]